jgi:hypothetical protein
MTPRRTGEYEYSRRQVVYRPVAFLLFGISLPSNLVLLLCSDAVCRPRGVRGRRRDNFYGILYFLLKSKIQILTPVHLIRLITPRMHYWSQD